MRRSDVEKNRHRCLRDLLVGMALFRSASRDDYHWAWVGRCRSETSPLGREHERARRAVLEVSCLAVPRASLHHHSGRVFSPRSSTTRAVQLLAGWGRVAGSPSVRVPWTESGPAFDLVGVQPHGGCPVLAFFARAGTQPPVATDVEVCRPGWTFYRLPKPAVREITFRCDTRPFAQRQLRRS
jgi:hypothetical protein